MWWGQACMAQLGTCLWFSSVRWGPHAPHTYSLLRTWPLYFGDVSTQDSFGPAASSGSESGYCLLRQLTRWHIPEASRIPVYVYILTVQSYWEIPPLHQAVTRRSWFLPMWVTQGRRIDKVTRGKLLPPPEMGSHSCLCRACSDQLYSG